MALTPVTAHWKLDESSGNATDSSGNGYTLTNTNVTYAAAKLNNGAVFDATSDKLSTTTVTQFETQVMSLSFWIKTTDATANVNVISRYEDSTKRSFRSLLNNTAGKISFLWYDTANNNTALVNTGVINNGNFHHIVVTARHNGSALISNVYTDGILTTNTNHGNVQIKNTGGARLDVGGANGIETSGFLGTMDEVSWFNFELTADEVSQLFNSGRANAYPFIASPEFYGAVFAANLDESSGNPVDSVMGNTITNTNVTYGQAKFNNGGIFDASTDRLYIGNPTALQIAGAKTIMFWLKGSSQGATNKAIINKGGIDSYTDSDWGAFHYSGQTIAFRFQPPAGVTFNEIVLTTGETSGLLDNALHCIEMEFVPSTAVRIYKDGTLLKQNTTSIGATTRTDKNLSIGAIETNQSGIRRDSANMTVDAVVIFNRNLTPTERAKAQLSQFPFSASAPTLQPAFFLNFV